VGDVGRDAMLHDEQGSAASNKGFQEAQ